VARESCDMPTDDGSIVAILQVYSGSRPSLVMLVAVVER